jgi:integrase
MGRLLESSITRLTVPKGKRDAYAWDSTLPGFGVRAFATGKKSFVVKYQLPSGQQRKMSLGPALPGTLAETRKKAQDILAKARLGQDVQGDKKASRTRAKNDHSAGDLVNTYLKIRKADQDCGDLSPKSYIEIEYHLRKLFLPLQTRRPAEIRQRDISDLVDELATTKGKRTADNCKTSISTFFAWLMEKEYVAGNPCFGVKRRNRSGPRERCLTLDEMAHIWRATELETEYDQIVRLLILTAARRDEIGALRRSEIDLDKGEIRLPKERVKSGRKTGKGHTIFLSEPAVRLLGNVARRTNLDLVFGSGEGPFSGWSHSKAALDLKLPEGMRATILNSQGEPEKNPNRWVLHDLRRSFGTHVVERGMATVEIKEAALGHRQQSIERTYNVSRYDSQRRELMQAWADLVLSLVDGSESNLVPLIAAE